MARPKDYIPRLGDIFKVNYYYPRGTGHDIYEIVEVNGDEVIYRKYGTMTKSELDDLLKQPWTELFEIKVPAEMVEKKI